MDKSILVASGHELMDAMSAKGIPPSAVIWVYTPETDAWKLWVVPHRSITNNNNESKRVFYRYVSEIMTKHQDTFGGIDAGDVEMMSKEHPAIHALSRMFHVTWKSDIAIGNTMLDDFYLPECIILLLDL